MYFGLSVNSLIRSIEESRQLESKKREEAFEFRGLGVLFDGCRLQVVGQRYATSGHSAYCASACCMNRAMNRSKSAFLFPAALRFAICVTPYFGC
jgi:hypothetical protein